MKKAKVSFDLEGAFNKIEERLILLEKKMDVLINRPAPRPFEPPQSPRPMQQRPGRFEHQRHERTAFHERQLFQVVCAECKKECQVPFKPTGDRPVYCKECFAKRKIEGSAFVKPVENKPIPEKKSFYTDFVDKKPSRQNRESGKKKALSHRKKKSK